VSVVRARLLILAVVCASAVTYAAAPASAADTLARCTSAPRDRALCGRVSVPLDRGGAIPGTIALRVKALPPAGGGVASGTLLALAGGPGQAAVPLLDTFAGVLRPLLRTRQLVTFDQRGTGGSGRLRCPALASTRGSLVSVVGRCAGELGARRTSYTTAASVADVEAVRSALGVDKLILYAASYGTKVALLYAATYPEHVDRLVLDSVVPPEGIDPFQRSTLASIPRVLRTVCAGDCGFTRDAGADVAALARRLARGPLHGTAFDGRGRAHRVRISAPELLSLLLNGDFDRYLRAALPAALRGALAGDPAPLLRLAAHAGAGSLSTSADSDAVYAATTCQDGGVPWAAGTPLEQRHAAVEAAAAAIADRAFAPFDRATVRALGSADICRAWPESPIPQPLPPLPPTPTLILSGDEDLRTPRIDALALAARLPGAHLLEVPDAGHGVLFSDPTDCAEQAVKAFVGGLVPGDCRRHESVMSPLPLAPRRLAELRAAKGLSGRSGRTVSALLRTLEDASGQLIEQILSGGQPRPFGGLRGGSAALERNRGLRLRGYAYVPGVTVSGLVRTRARSFTLTVGGAAAAHGRLSLSRRGVAGRLDGEPVRVSARALGWRSGSAPASAAAAAADRATLTSERPSPLRPPAPAPRLRAPAAR
jgi:pimeloyl-ACP methyl ester carboxylesterase